MATVTVIYLILFLVGLVFAILSAVFSHVLDLGGDHDLGDVTGGLHGADLSGAEMPTFSPINTVTLATFITTFGAAGLLTSFFWKGPGSVVPGLLIATLSGFIVAGLVFWMFYKVFSITQSSSESRVAELIGETAEVIAPIPPDGMGEVAYVHKGSRLNAPAKSEDGKPIPVHTSVTITRVVGGYIFVKPVSGRQEKS